MGIYNLPVFWWITGFIVGQVYFVIEAGFFGFKRYQAFLAGVINLVMLCIGAKLMYIIENFEFVLREGIRFAGFSLFGAIFIQMLAALIICRIFNKDVRTVCSMLIVPFLIMLGFYRMDCLKSGCCGGITVSGYTFPTQITESVFCFLMAMFFSVKEHCKKEHDGTNFILFYIIYGGMRFVLEFFRLRNEILWKFSISHLWAALSVAFGIVLLIHQKRKTNEKQIL